MLAVVLVETDGYVTKDSMLRVTALPFGRKNLPRFFSQSPSEEISPRC
jgi:hypothetical protein